MTMIFGAGLPIMFPVALVSIFTIYLVENFSLYYVVKTPPNYDGILG